MPSSGWWWSGCFWQAGQFVGIFLALQHGVAAGLVALLAGSSPMLVAVFATFLLDEHLDPVQWLGSAIGVAGVVLAVAEELDGGGSALGFVFALIGLAGLVGGPPCSGPMGRTSTRRWPTRSSR